MGRSKEPDGANEAAFDLVDGDGLDHARRESGDALVVDHLVAADEAIDDLGVQAGNVNRLRA
jgi:hypothetical protein